MLDRQATSLEVLHSTTTETTCQSGSMPPCHMGRVPSQEQTWLLFQIHHRHPWLMCQRSQICQDPPGHLDLLDRLDLRVAQCQCKTKLGGLGLQGLGLQALLALLAPTPSTLVSWWRTTWTTCNIWLEMSVPSIQYAQERTVCASMQQDVDGWWNWPSAFH